ncbi:MAG: hypothetical protein D6796_13205 [Caldilineae bacterium]|nr:MAG: hypothetical protein D6796_13205 [Caldilineae bacterium]
MGTPAPEPDKRGGTVPRADRLEDISGIGPAFARRLHEAGVHTFAELARLTPRQVRDIIQPQNWQKIEPDIWIAQAKERSGYAAEMAGGIKR